MSLHTKACNNIVQARIRRAATVGSRLSPHRLHLRNLLDLHTRTSIILSKTNWGTSMVRRTVWTMGIGNCTTTKTMQQFSQRAATVRTSGEIGHHVNELAILFVPTTVSGLWEIASAKRQGCRRPSVNCSCGTAALPDSLHCLDPKNCTCGNQPTENVFFWSIPAMMPNITGMSASQREHARGVS